MFFINPPFGEASDSRAKNRDIKMDITTTKVYNMMKKSLIGSQSQIYAQFIYRILKIKEKYGLDNIVIASFLPPLFFTGSSPEKLRVKLKESFEFKGGFLFKASDFANVSAEWAISFSVWEDGNTLETDSLNFSVEEIDKSSDIKVLKKKKIYSLEKRKRLSNWIEVKKEKELDESKKGVVLKSGLSVENKTYKCNPKDLGYLINDSNNVYANTKGIYIINSKISRHIKTTAIREDNIEKILLVYSARAVIESAWDRQIDEYCIPDESILQDKELLGDALIYSIFSIKANQTSLRSLIVDEEEYNIFNEFFYMSNKEIKEKADECGNIELYNDATKYPKERFIFCKLQNMNLSKEAKSVLDKARGLTLDSIQYRNKYNETNKNDFLNTWDAGWYQIKRLLKEEMSNELNEFDILFKELERKIREKIYKYKFFQ
ncbi:MAG: hypothetical protein ACRC6T_14340 [Sarcina sp.]